MDLFMGGPWIVLGLMALLGSLIEQKGWTNSVSATLKTMVGVVILTQGMGMISGAVLPLIEMSTLGLPSGTGEPMGSDKFLAVYGTQVGWVMLCTFVINLVVARFTPLKNLFLTGHVLFWLAFMFMAVAVEGGLTGLGLVVFATVMTSVYVIVTPALMVPFVARVTGNDAFTLGHPAMGLSLIVAYVARWTGDKRHSTETLQLPSQLAFLREIPLTSALVMFGVYLIMGWSLDGPGSGVAGERGWFVFSLMQGVLFGAGLTILLKGVRMMLAEIIPAFKAIGDKVIPGVRPAFDCTTLFPYAPNAVLIGFMVSMLSSTLVVVVMGGSFSWLLLPLAITCFFEIGTAAVFGNTEGGLRGVIIGSAVAGVVMMLLLGFSLPFVATTIGDWMLVFGGNDYSLWGIVGGSLVGLFGPS